LLPDFAVDGADRTAGKSGVDFSRSDFENRLSSVGLGMPLAGDAEPEPVLADGTVGAGIGAADDPFAADAGGGELADEAAVFDS
jgi:hypothetical protein